MAYLVVSPDSTVHRSKPFLLPICLISLNKLFSSFRATANLPLIFLFAISQIPEFIAFPLVEHTGFELVTVKVIV